MRRLLRVLVGCVAAGSHLLAQTMTTGAAAPELVLTGIVELPASTQDAPALKRVFLEAVTSSSVRCYSLVEGEKRGDLEVVLVNSKEGKVSLRFREQIVELSFAAQSNPTAVARLAERQKDASHTQYHTLRAKLDRERDAAQRRP
jgi:hypothetical protein